MATIRLTDRVKNEIMQRADRMFGKITEDGTNKIESKSSLIFDHIYSLDIQRKMNELGRDFFSVTTDFVFTVKSSVLKYSTTVSLRFTPPVLAGTALRSYGTSEYKSIDIDAPENILLFNELHQTLLDMSENEARRAAMKSHLKQLMSHNQTVGQCIKSWPQFTEILPSDILDKHHEISVKSKSEALSISAEDLSAVNSALMAAKLLQG